MRLLFLTDTHIRGNSPRHRIDDFPQTLRRKLEEVIEIVEREQVDYVLHGGDLFDRPTLSPAVVREFSQLFRRIPVPIYTVPGNHDIYGHNPDTIERTMLGLLEGFGAIQLLREGKYVKLEKEGCVVQLTGQPFHYELDKRDFKLDYHIENQISADFCIHIVHGMLVHRPLPEGVAYTLTEQIWGSDVDLWLSGHYHAGFPLQQKNGQTILNPGAISRINSHPSEMKRQPQIALIDCNQKLTVQLVPLKAAAQGNEVLDRSQLEQAAYRQEKLNSFVQQVQEAGQFQMMDITDIIEEISRLTEIDSDVKKEALEWIAKVQEEEQEREGVEST
ncbi:DNA repair exonuclease SbcCD nuclease subunit [Seinonella peptonophila]|uniref:DNA repair exonuclease SbcCD nuclease subunit n=1 Tax=Seinonella peptonophila TaxID=112248 RepID=A0A1M4TAB8_9BACL|nr:metallophosphoesterase [Seinonella peptonophila]SHE41423.1 DNA repair exonuclease SbcCD nuclease subunit [Seinonella peptonophila]